MTLGCHEHVLSTPQPAGVGFLKAPGSGGALSWAPRGTRVGTTTVIRHLDATGSAELDAAPVGDLLAQLTTLPDLTRIDVYPDITRKTWGFPSGVSTISAGRDPVSGSVSLGGTDHELHTTARSRARVSARRSRVHPCHPRGFKQGL